MEEEINYRAIPVTEALRIADAYAKDQVLIFAWDRASGMMHTTTYGRTLEDKHMAAIGGDRVAAILADVAQTVVYEDFRTGSAALFVVSVGGDWARCEIVAEADLQQKVHSMLCTCSELWRECDIPDVRVTCESLTDDDSWTFSYPDRERFAWTHDTGEGALVVTRLTSRELI